MKGITSTMIIFLSFFLASCACYQSHADELPEGDYVTGYVFEDTNNSGTMDEGNPGIPEVLVSNQREVVQTDHEGRYYLPLEDNMTIFVVKPANYQVPLCDQNLPQFYYHHYPEGSPDGLKFSGIEPTGDLPEYVNFPLIPGDDPDEFEVMVMGDPQPRTEQDLDYLRDGFVSEVREEGFLFGWALGDIMFDDLSLFPRYNRLMAHLGFPLYKVLGNHDIDFEGDELHAKDNFRSHFGPNYYALTYNNVHFFSIDNIEWKGKQTESFWGDYRGVIGERQLEWIANMLEYIPKDDWLVFGNHIPLYTPNSDSERNNTIDREEFFALIEDRTNILTLAAHTHTNEYNFLRAEQGWHGEDALVHIVCGAICGTWWGGPELPDGFPYMLQSDGVPCGYFVIHFDGNGYQERFVPLAKHPDFQIRVSSPRGTISRKDLEDTSIIANVFMGNEKTEVKASISGKEPFILQQTYRTDPFAHDLFTAHEDKYLRWVGAAETEHIWTGTLPDGLKKGAYSIEIEARLHDGRVFRELQVFEVVE